jgi:signal transduction histidine kinase
MNHEPLPDKENPGEKESYREYGPALDEGRLHSELEKLLYLYDYEFVGEKGSSLLENKMAADAHVTPRIYADKDGLPVTYDAATHEKQKRAKPDGFSMLWHELLSPLTIIKGYTSTLLQLKDDITAEQQMQYIQGIESASNRMIRLMENLRDISRLEEPDNLYIQRVSLTDMLRTVAHEMQNQTTKHCIKIRPSERMPLVNADPEKIEQVMNNLVMNAIKYSPNGGDIEIEVCTARDEEELWRLFNKTPHIKLPCIIVSVADHGIGIPEEEIDNIFDRFYRIKNKLTHNAQGAGLGLYICKIIMEAHSGHIWAQNRLQGGSIFNFSLPLDR